MSGLAGISPGRLSSTAHHSRQAGCDVKASVRTYRAASSYGSHLSSPLPRRHLHAQCDSSTAKTSSHRQPVSSCASYGRALVGQSWAVPVAAQPVAKSIPLVSVDGVRSGGYAIWQRVGLAIVLPFVLSS
eukprot:scaffold2707_cov417-Prasinococcus_capsulatus_cf.AAC.34